MKLLYSGKTKDVYAGEEGTVILKFKDDVTGTDGVFDPGANAVGLTIDGMGQSGLRMTTFFFEKMAAAHIHTHFVASDLQQSTLTVKKANMFGNGLEVICRYRAVGSFYRRYGQYCEEGQALDAFVEVTLKDDERNDPPISKEGLVMLGLLTAQEYDELEAMTKTISGIVQETLADKGLELYDIKLEFGKDEKGQVMLIDEISGGNMRVYRGDEYIAPLVLEQLLFS